MKVSIEDAATLRAIGPNELAAYLRSRAWKQVEQIGDRATIWTADAHGSGEYEILLPLDATLEEYARRISEVLQTLEVAEHRSQLDIVRDIAATTSDVLRVRLVHGLIENGTLPLEHGVMMIQGARDLALAAACAAARPRALYSSRKPQEALAYMSKLRMGQTEVGSFVVAIQSPVTPRAQTQMFEPVDNNPADEPFERRALLTLTNGLTAIQRAAASAAASGNFQPFQDAVGSGVSANLCDALLSLSMDSTTEEITLQISWSPTRRAADKTPTQFRFRRDTFPLLREASRVLRASASIEDVSIIGTVTALRREDNTDIGKVTLSAWVEEVWRQVRMDLSDEDYRKAVKAHDERDVVQCVGELTKENRRYFLRNVRDFTIMEYPVDDAPDDSKPFASSAATNQKNAEQSDDTTGEIDPFADD